MNSSMPKVERGGNIVIVTLGDWTVRDVDNRIAADLEGVKEEFAPCHLLLDFGNTDQITSEELGTLIGLHKRLTASGGRLTLFNLSPKVYEVFTVTRLHTFLSICREGPEELPEAIILPNQ